MGTLVGGRAGAPGALAFGLGEDLALIWGIHHPGREFLAYLHHAPAHPGLSAVHWAALRSLGAGSQDLGSMYVLAASQRDIRDAEVDPFLKMGVRGDRILVYTGALIPQIGVTAEGWVGEIG